MLFALDPHSGDTTMARAKLTRDFTVDDQLDLFFTA